MTLQKDFNTLQTQFYTLIVALLIVFFVLILSANDTRTILSHKADRICVNETIDILCSDWVIQDNECPVPYNKTICLDTITKEVCTIR